MGARKRGSGWSVETAAAKQKRAVLELVASSPSSRVSKWVTPDGDVVVVARAVDGDFRQGAGASESFCTHGTNECACLYRWFEEHK